MQNKHRNFFHFKVSQLLGRGGGPASWDKIPTFPIFFFFEGAPNTFNKSTWIFSSQTVCSLKCHSSREFSQNTEKRILKNNTDPKSQQKVPKIGGPFGLRGWVAESPNKKGLVIRPFFYPHPYHWSVQWTEREDKMKKPTDRSEPNQSDN